MSRIRLDVDREFIQRIYQQLRLSSFSKMNVGRPFYERFIQFWIVLLGIYWGKLFLLMINRISVKFKELFYIYLSSWNVVFFYSRGNGKTARRLLWRTFWWARSSSTRSGTSRFDQSKKFWRKKRFFKWNLMKWAKKNSTLSRNFQLPETLLCFSTLTVKLTSAGKLFGLVVKIFPLTC